jgi:hypothetical protein
MEWILVGGARVNGGGQIWSMYVIYLYEYRTIKSAEIVLRRGMGVKENDGGIESNQGTL